MESDPDREPELTIEGETPNGKEFLIEYLPENEEEKKIKLTGIHDNKKGGKTKSTEYLSEDKLGQAIAMHEEQAERLESQIQDIENTIDDLKERGAAEPYTHMEEKIVGAIKKYQAKNAYENKTDELENNREKASEQREWADTLQEMRDRIETES